jgi:hypothetical protein
MVYPSWLQPHCDSARPKEIGTHRQPLAMLCQHNEQAQPAHPQHSQVLLEADEAADVASITAAANSVTVVMPTIAEFFLDRDEAGNGRWLKNAAFLAKRALTRCS